MSEHVWEQFRIGHGYDLHRLESPPPEGMGRPMIVGGVLLDHPTGPVGHSDGDVLYHAITDALLGALALPDIGQHFPDDDQRYKGEDSSVFLKEAVLLAREDGWVVANLDTTVILEKPRLSPHKEVIRNNIAQLLNIAHSRVNVKGKTHEGVDAVGQGLAIEAHAVALLVRVL